MNSASRLLAQVLGGALVIVALDQFTKRLAKLYLEPVGQITLVEDWLKLTFVENEGIAFGINLGGQWTLTLLSIFAVLGISLYLYSLRRENLCYKLAFACVLGGAIGNLIDRILYGRVVDFVHFDLYRGYIGSYYLSLWPVFNVADIAISTGVGIMFVWHKRIFDPEPKEALNEPPPAETPKAEEGTKEV
ncbi:MAG: signal peptidase II [Chloroherpetonaceae bacterium]|nr:signal peptidase II [Chloroherpetonaceae bacterium]MDW8436894.1 signal peptidase II [Chloroherpetonaceae bacterium]